MLGGAGTGSDTLAYGVDDGYQEFYNIEKSELSRIILSVQKEFAAIKMFLSMGE